MLSLLAFGVLLQVHAHAAFQEQQQQEPVPILVNGEAQEQEPVPILANSNVASDRIISGGTLYSSWAIPHQVQVDGACGGSLISLYDVLTAAHCMFGPDGSLVEVELGIGSGSWGYQKIVGNIYAHPTYQNNIYNGFDAAIINLDHAVDISSGFVRPASVHALANEVGTGLYISGYGVSDFDSSGNRVVPTHLQYGYNTVNQIFTNFGENSFMALQHPTETVPPLESICFGDSGGPAGKLLRTYADDDGYTRADWSVFGITSFVFSGPGGEQCGGIGPGGLGARNLSAYFVRTSQIIPWIKENTKGVVTYDYV